ncbi:MAG: CHAT domain-containing protein [Leptolyngbyaceae cyanobacterium CAN_BIN12]|nr:CHAT domain-containing protein [Leptolyngbyaceae cyanobacterium CAN_BIN12]
MLNGRDGKKLPPVAALREAQLSMWKDRRWESPYDWAGFVLQDEWR